MDHLVEQEVLSDFMLSLTANAAERKGGALIGREQVLLARNVAQFKDKVDYSSVKDIIYPKCPNLLSCSRKL